MNSTVIDELTLPIRREFVRNVDVSQPLMSQQSTIRVSPTSIDLFSFIRRKAPDFHGVLSMMERRNAPFAAFWGIMFHTFSSRFIQIRESIAADPSIFLGGRDSAVRLIFAAMLDVHRERQRVAHGHDLPDEMAPPLLQLGSTNQRMFTAIQRSEGIATLSNLGSDRFVEILSDADHSQPITIRIAREDLRVRLHIFINFVHFAGMTRAFDLVADVGGAASATPVLRFPRTQNARRSRTSIPPESENRHLVMSFYTYMDIDVRDGVMDNAEKNVTISWERTKLSTSYTEASIPLSTFIGNEELADDPQRKASFITLKIVKSEDINKLMSIDELHDIYFPSFITAPAPAPAPALEELPIVLADEIFLQQIRRALRINQPPDEFRFTSMEESVVAMRCMPKMPSSVRESIRILSRSAVLFDPIVTRLHTVHDLDVALRATAGLDPRQLEAFRNNVKLKNRLKIMGVIWKSLSPAPPDVPPIDSRITTFHIPDNFDEWPVEEMKLDETDPTDEFESRLFEMERTPRVLTIRTASAQRTSFRPKGHDADLSRVTVALRLSQGDKPSGILLDDGNTEHQKCIRGLYAFYPEITKIIDEQDNIIRIIKETAWSETTDAATGLEDDFLQQLHIEGYEGMETNDGHHKAARSIIMKLKTAVNRSHTPAIKVISPHLNSASIRGYETVRMTKLLGSLSDSKYLTIAITNACVFFPLMALVKLANREFPAWFSEFGNDFDHQEIRDALDDMALGTCNVTRLEHISRRREIENIATSHVMDPAKIHANTDPDFGGFNEGAIRGEVQNIIAMGGDLEVPPQTILEFLNKCTLWRSVGTRDSTSPRQEHILRYPKISSCLIDLELVPLPPPRPPPRPPT